MILSEGTLSRLGKAADHMKNQKNITYPSCCASETARGRWRDGLASMRPATKLRCAGDAALVEGGWLGGKRLERREAGTIEDGDGDGKGLVK
jgi:hypothetical protein